ncbi:MAG: hypothetical protein VW082_07500 [Candidatus Nanopelagicales bacterium]|jgi:hypothetical protein
MTNTVLHVNLPPDLALRDRHRRTCQRMARILHPALAPVREVTIVSAGLALEIDLPEGATALPSSMSGPEVLAMLAPVAAGLAHLHDAGFASGAVARDSLRRRPDGSGVLVGWQPGGEAHDDVADLADLLAQLLPEGSVGADVVSVLVCGADPDPGARPTMARMAAALDLAARSHPVVDGAPSLRTPTSPLAVRRSAVPVVESSDTATVEVDEVGRRGRGRRESARGPRHAASSGGRSSRWRWFAVAAGIAAIAFIGVGAVGADEPAIGTCRVETAAAEAGANAASSPPPPARSQTRSRDRSR